MANQEPLDLLKQGVEPWNQWREQGQEIWPNLPGADLTGANLRGAYLGGVNLSRANLSRANLSRVNLGGAKLIRANLTKATFRKAYLLRADFTEADLTGADLRGADLRGANFRRAILTDADLGQAHVQDTIFAQMDLRTIKGLVKICHEGPSVVELQTVRLPHDGSTSHFLRGTGVSDEWIDFCWATMVHPIQYYSCFISYSSKDEMLARRLHTNLQDHGVRCWFAPEDMKIGDKIRACIDEAIFLQDKLLLLLSEHSIASTWVEDEVEAALEKEQQQQREVLFPVRLDESVMQTSTAWAAKLRRTRHIGDFASWTDSQAYQQAFERLLRDLKTKP